MTSVSTIPDATSTPRPSAQTHSDDNPDRLRLKPKGPTTGWVDGGWWPHSRDLAAEVPRLVTVLETRLGRIERVSFHLGEWGATASKINCAGGVVRLDGYHSQRANTVDVLGTHHRVTLLVVDPETSAQTAHAALTAAGHRGNTDDVATLLRSSPHSSDVPGGADGQRADVEGGRMPVAF
jgi:uncharacterized protein DUF5994